MKHQDILVIGGGVVGVCSAYYLAAAGERVTIVERGEICSGCSSGNAGLVVPSHSIPLAAPGVLTKALRWMLDVQSPFYIRPRLDREFFSWLWRFRRACTETVMRRGIPVIRDLSRASAELYQQLASIHDLDFGYRQNGLLMLFRSRAGYEEGLKEAELLQEFGIGSTVLDSREIHQREPTVLPTIAGGVVFPEDAQLLPADFVRGLACECEKLGVRICPSTEVLKFETYGGRISTVTTTRGDFRPDQVVLAAGAWSPILTRELRTKLPMEAAKGYSVTVKRPATCPSIPLLLGEAKVAVTPMGKTLRFAGTLELAGLDLSVNVRRVDAMMQATRDYISGTENLEVTEIWRGLRACTPDGLPVIGRSNEFANLVVATGHAMIGMSIGPITGKLVSQLVLNEPPALDLTPLSLERFD